MAGISHSARRGALRGRRTGAVRGVAARVLVAAAVALACALLHPAVAAAEASGSITIEAAYRQGETAVPVSGDTWGLAQVASATPRDDGTLAYETCADFAPLDRDWASLDASGLREAARDLGTYARDHDLLAAGRSVTDGSGRASFLGLPTGLYVAVRTDAADANQALACDPVLVSVPLYEDGSWAYDVTVDPKFEGPDGPSSDDPPDNPSDTTPETPSETPGAQSPESGGTAGGILHDLGLPQLGDPQTALALLAAAAALACAAAGWLLHLRTRRGAAATPQEGDAPAPRDP